jgi:hypothetical protein
MKVKALRLIPVCTATNVKLNTGNSTVLADNKAHDNSTLTYLYIKTKSMLCQSSAFASFYLESFLITNEENINFYSSWIKIGNKQYNATITYVHIILYYD